jgi:hypothetical protein
MDCSQLHRAVDQLSPAPAEALLRVDGGMVGRPPPGESADAPSAISAPAGRWLSFTAAGSGLPDLAEHAEDYLRAGGFGPADS